MEATLLLCDAAEQAEGKLYILGAGWSRLRANVPANIAVAVLLHVPWDQTNRPFLVRIVLMTDDGAPVQIEDQPVEASGQLEMGRPPGAKAGESFPAPLAFKFNGLALDPGGYRFELHIDGAPLTNVPFRTVGGTP